LISQTLYDIFAPQLYTKFSVGNLSSIFTGFKYGNSMFKHIRHLHLYSGTYNDEPTYTELVMMEAWEALDGYGEEKIPWSGTDEVLNCVFVGNCIQHSLQHDRLSPFPKLHSISLEGYQDHMWGLPMAEGWEESALKDPSMSPCYKMLPLALLAIPSVEHFCQSTEFGPLALRPFMYTTSRQLSIKIFTFHLRHPDRCQGLKQNFAPIVSGAINRYYYIHDPTAENIDVNSHATPGQAVAVSLVKYFSKSQFDLVGSDMKPLERSESINFLLKIR
jgi:hypothetical protein